MKRSEYEIEIFAIAASLNFSVEELISLIWVDDYRKQASLMRLLPYDVNSPPMHSYRSVGSHVNKTAERIRQIMARTMRRAHALGGFNDKISVRALGVCTRTLNCLLAENIKTIDELKLKSDEELLLIYNFGVHSLKEVKTKLLAVDMLRIDK